MVQAVYEGTVLADSDTYEEVEGNIYFPHDAIYDEYFEASLHTTECPWKGTAHYYDIVLEDERLENAAWYYPEPKEEASHIKGYVAFYDDTITIKQ